MLEEMLDLFQRDGGQVGVVFHHVVAHRQLAGRHRDQLFVAARLVLHQQHADKAAVHDGAGDDGAGVGDNHVAGVAVARQRMRHKAVIAGVAHGCVEKPVHHQRAGLLVHLILDRLAADGDFDDDVHVVRRVFSDGDCFKAHG